MQDSGDGEVSGPTLKGDADASDPSRVGSDETDKIQSGDGEASDPTLKGNLQDSGDGDVSDPSLKGDAGALDPSRTIGQEVDSRASGDGDASDPTLKGDADASDPTIIRDFSRIDPAFSIRVTDETRQSGDGEPSDPTQAIAGDAEGTDPERQIPGQVDLKDSGDGETSDPTRGADAGESVSADDADEAPSGPDRAEPAVGAAVAGQFPQVEAAVNPSTGIDAPQEIPVEMLSGILDAGVVDQAKLSSLLGGGQIKPDQTSQVSSPVAQPVDVNVNADGSSTVVHRGIDGTTVHQYDADGNLIAEQHDGPDGSSIITYGDGFMTVELIMNDGTYIEAVHYDDGGGEMTITNPDGESQSTTVTPPSGTSGSNDTSGDQGDSGVDASGGSDTSDDSDDDSDKDDNDGDTEAADMPDGRRRR